MDVVYPYRRSPGDFELRYSLRSLSNVPHDRVIIAGEIPLTTSDRVVTVKNPRTGADRYMSSTSNIFAAIGRADVSSDFIVMNDDIFVLKPWTFQHADRGPLSDYLDDPSVKGYYRSRVADTLKILKAHGIDDPLFFGLHTPTVYNRARLVDLMRDFPMPKNKYLLRTLYNNIFPQPSIRRDDVKVKSWSDDTEADDILSISDNVAALPSFKTWIDYRFPAPSVYEVSA
jgi:hypothetical protein